jgi:hypothetical protein
LSALATLLHFADCENVLLAIFPEKRPVFSLPVIMLPFLCCFAPYLLGFFENFTLLSCLTQFVMSKAVVLLTVAAVFVGWYMFGGDSTDATIQVIEKSPVLDQELRKMKSVITDADYNGYRNHNLRYGCTF